MRALDLLTHLCALTGLAYAARAVRATRGWLQVPAVAALDDAPSLSVVVPARNEERTIARCVRSLLAQTYPDFEIVAVDDRSDDATATILAELAREDSRLTVVAGEPLPDGWVGKPWALAQGAQRARGAWLLFTDADTFHQPSACTSSLAFARARSVDAVSLATYQELGSLAERVLLPTILGVVLIASGSIAELNDPSDTSHALANGQYVLVSRTAYDALGGHAALRGEIVEDIAFARRLKADGRFRLLLAGGEHLVRVRMYTSFAGIWDGFTKNMYLGARGDLRALGAGVLVLGALSFVPALLAADALARKRPLRALEALLCLANGMAVQVHGLARTTLPKRLAWYAPIGYALTAALLINSSWCVVSGRGVAWRGRRYSGRLWKRTPVDLSMVPAVPAAERSG